MPTDQTKIHTFVSLYFQAEYLSSCWTGLLLLVPVPRGQSEAGGGVGVACLWGAKVCECGAGGVRLSMAYWFTSSWLLLLANERQKGQRATVQLLPGTASPRVFTASYACIQGERPAGLRQAGAKVVGVGHLPSPGRPRGPDLNTPQARSGPHVLNLTSLV